MKVSIWACLFTGSLFFCRGAFVQADPRAEQIVTYPLPMEVESQTVPSGLFITLSARVYQQPASVALQGYPDNSPEGVLRTLLTAIKNADVKLYESVSGAPASPQNEGLTVTIDGGPEDKLALYRQVLEGAGNPVVLFRFDLGGAVYIPVDANRGDSACMPFVLVQTPQGWKNASDWLGAPVCQEVSVLTEQMKDNPHQFKPMDKPKNAYQIQLPAIYGSGDGPVISFQGCRVDYNPKSPPANSTGLPACSENAWAALQAYGNIYSTLVLRHTNELG